MNGYDVKRLALILALQAEIEAMKAENAKMEHENNDVIYDGSDFSEMADKLRNLAYCRNEQLNFAV